MNFSLSYDINKQFNIECLHFESFTKIQFLLLIFDLRLTVNIIIKFKSMALVEFHIEVVLKFFREKI